MKYQLTYAGVPFADGEQELPLTEIGGADIDPMSFHVPRRGLLAEYYRVCPEAAARDFDPGTSPTKNMLGLAYGSRQSPSPSPTLTSLGEWHYPSGASRWSVFRGLMTYEMLAECLERLRRGERRLFTMQSVPDGLNSTDADYLLQTDMYLLPPRPVGGTGESGAFIITLVDERYYWRGNSTYLGVEEGATWGDLIETLADAIGVTVDYSPISAAYGSPEPDSPLWSAYEEASALLDVVAWNVGRRFVRDLDGTYTLLAHAESAARAQANKGFSRGFAAMGGNYYYSGAGLSRAAANAVVPSQVIVTFPEYVVGDDPVPHFLNPRYAGGRTTSWNEAGVAGEYTVSVPVTSGGAFVSGMVGTSQVTLQTTAKALYSGEADSSPVNLSGTRALAMRVAGDLYDYVAGAAYDEAFPGTLAVSPEGLHDIVWTYSDRRGLAATRVVRGDWNVYPGEFQHGTINLSGLGPRVPGAGGKSVALSVRGTSDYLASGGGIFSGLTSGGDRVLLASGGFGWPTEHNWFLGTLSGEQMVLSPFDGSGSQIIRRATNGTYRLSHASGTVVYHEDAPVHGTNLITFNPGQYVYPGEWTSGGVQEVIIEPQVQSVYITGSTPVSLNGIDYYPAEARLFGVEGFQNYWTCYAVERTGQALSAGDCLAGQYVGYSPSPVPVPTYLVNAPGTGTFNPGGGTTFTNTSTVTFQGNVVFASGSTVTYQAGTTNTYLSGYSANYLFPTLNYSGGTFNYYGGSTTNYYSGSATNYYSGSLNYYGPGSIFTFDQVDWQVTGNTTLSIDALATLTLVGGPIVFQNPVELCGWWALCYSSLTVTGPGDLSLGGTPKPVALITGPTSATTLYGISTTAPNGGMVTLVNGSSYAITLAHESASSGSTSYRFLLPGGRDWPLLPGASVTLWRDTVSGRWRPVGSSTGPLDALAYVQTLPSLGTTPDSADSIALYDASASQWKQVEYDDLTAGLGAPATPPSTVSLTATPTWFVKTLTHADLTAAATSQDVSVYTLPAKAALHAAVIRTKTAGSGGGVAAMNLQLRLGGNNAASVTNGLLADDITAQYYAGAPVTGWSVFAQSWTATSTIEVQFSANVNVVDLTGGEWEVYLLLSTLG